MGINIKDLTYEEFKRLSQDDHFCLLTSKKNNRDTKKIKKFFEQLQKERDEVNKKKKITSYEELKEHTIDYINDYLRRDDLTDEEKEQILKWTNDMYKEWFEKKKREE